MGRKNTKPVIAIHGGAGNFSKEYLSPTVAKQYRKALKKALIKGYDVLKQNGTAIQAVKESITYLEDCPLFNAGRGSVFTNQGKHEMDAAIMDGKTLHAGSVLGVKKVKNPILLADTILTHSEHVCLAGKGALEFAKVHELIIKNKDYFFNQYRFNQWENAQNENKVILDHHDKKFGTVGAVALDKHQNLAAGTSTGGMTNKLYGRIGDSPIIGAGTYANNLTCAVSCTGHGEYFIRTVLAHEISSLMKLKSLTLKKATKVALKTLTTIGGSGGFIAIDYQGNIQMPFNTTAMYRAYHNAKEMNIQIF